MFSNSKTITELTPSDFRGADIPKAKGTSLVFFGASWCGHCASLKPDFERLGGAAMFIDLYGIDCGQYEQVPVMLDKYGVHITGYPTLYIYKDGRPVKEYKGGRSYEDMLNTMMKEVQSNAR